MAAKFKDYYEILGVPRTASAKDIRSAFRKLARRYHPDVNREAGAVDRFKEVNEANEVLSDPEKRRRYDQLGPGWQQMDGVPAHGNPFAGAGRATGPGGEVEYRTVSQEELEGLFGATNPFSDFFHDLFGRTATRDAPTAKQPRVRPRRGDDVESDITVSLEDVAAGVTRTVELSDARGKRRVEVRIPPGVTDGAKVRAAGQGGAGRGDGGSGDLLLRVRVAPHPLFIREGKDVRARVAVPLATALLGGTVDVPTPKGRRVQLTVPPDTQNGARLRLRGLGLPEMRGDAKGDLIAEVDVRLPVPLTAGQRALVEQLRATGDGGSAG